MYFKHTPDIIKPLAKDLTFTSDPTENAIYLTFDDGPHPTITPWVLDQLAAFDAKGTFFLLGANAEANPALVERIRNEGHTIGNHGYEHLSGWKTKDTIYFRNVAQADELLNTSLYRPPYGQITLKQVKAIKKTHEVIMWSDLSADFDESLEPDQCFHHATHKVQPGSIIVFHDSEKAWPRLEWCLPKALDFYDKEGFKMRTLPA